MDKKLLSYSCIILIWLAGLPNKGNAQIKTSVTFSNPWINHAKDFNQDRKEYRKYLNDSLKRFKKLNKFYKKQFDSLARSISTSPGKPGIISPTDLTVLYKLRKLQGEYQFKKDSLSYLDGDGANEWLQNLYEKKSDSLKLIIDDISIKYSRISADEIIGLENESGDSLVNILGMPSDSIRHHIISRDSLLLNQLTEYLESYAHTITGIDELQVEQQRILAEQERLDAYKADFNRYRDKKNLKSNLQKLSKSELVSKNKTLNNAHKTLSTYKRKYLTLPSSNDLEGGIKRTSLEDKSFWERIKVGGNLRISQREYLDIDFAPSIAYLANTKWSIGTEFVFRGEFGNGKKWQNSFNSNTYGGRVFTDYSVYKSFFAHAEFENIFTNIGDRQKEINTVQSVPGAMAGMGKTFGLGKNVNGKMIIQYNFIHDETNELYASPWVVRVGFEVKRLKQPYNK